MTVVLDGLEVKEATKIQGEIMERLELLRANLESLPDESPFQSSSSFSFDAKQLQNRDRSRSNYIFQMQSIAKNLDYSKVSISRDANSGAPMVFPRGISVPARQLGKKDNVTMSDGAGGSRKIPVRYAVVDAGDLLSSHDSHGAKTKEYAGKVGIMALNNGRVAGIKSAYQGGNAKEYKKAMLQDIDAHGVSAKAVDSIDKPVLVRLFDEASLEGIKDAGTASNEQVGASLGATEQGFSDAERLSLEELAGLESGDIANASNRGFVRSFINAIGDNGTAGDMMDADGLLSASGARRIEAALIAKAFDDQSMLADISESSNSDLKSLGTAIKNISGRWAVMRNAAEEGLISSDVDITKNMIEALSIVRKSRKTKHSIYDLVNQSDILSGSVSETTKALLKLFYQGETYNRIRAASKISSALEGYLDQAMKTSPSADMFGFKPSPDDILSQQQKNIDLNLNQKGIFDSINTYLEKSAFTLDGLDMEEKTEIQANIAKWFDELKLEIDLIERTKTQGKIRGGLSELNQASEPESLENNTESLESKLEEPQSKDEIVEEAIKSATEVMKSSLADIHNSAWYEVTRIKAMLNVKVRDYLDTFLPLSFDSKEIQDLASKISGDFILNARLEAAKNDKKDMFHIATLEPWQKLQKKRLHDYEGTIPDIDTGEKERINNLLYDIRRLSSDTMRSETTEKTEERMRFLSGKVDLLVATNEVTDKPQKKEDGNINTTTYEDRIKNLASEENIELFDAELDKLANDLEKAGLMDKYEGKLSELADKLNTLLANT